MCFANDAGFLGARLENGIAVVAVVKCNNYGK